MEPHDIIIFNIKNIINQKGLKQKAVAERSGYNEKEFSHMLNGRKIIKGEDILPIAIALGVEPNDICKKQNTLDQFERR